MNKQIMLTKPAMLTTATTTRNDLRY